MLDLETLVSEGSSSGSLHRNKYPSAVLLKMCSTDRGQAENYSPLVTVDISTEIEGSF